MSLEHTNDKAGRFERLAERRPCPAGLGLRAETTEASWAIG